MAQKDSNNEKADSILVLGTSSHAGKSIVVTGLCKLFSEKGYDVTPFKAQNMSNNSWVTEEGAEIGISQAVQAWAADKAPTRYMNPVLLKPKGEGVSQVILFGDPYGDRSVEDYYSEFNKFRKKVGKAYKKLENEHEIVICEGAGGAAEINLHDRDLSNIETARFTDAPIILVSDIERGGVFASIYGTIELLPQDIRQNVEGIVINKFRGSKEILKEGINKIEKITDVPVLGVLPYRDLNIPSEDSLSIKDKDNSEGEVRINVVKFPHISNFTDFEPLERHPDVKVDYISLDDRIKDVDAVILPGTKNTIDDLKKLKNSDLYEDLTNFNGFILGVCGGYQMIGEKLIDEGSESVENVDKEISGLGLIPVETYFDSTNEKKTEQVELEITCNNGFFSEMDGKVSGYEIHMGETSFIEDVENIFEHDGAFGDDVMGTYLHGLFWNDNFREAFLRKIGLRKKNFIKNQDPFDDLEEIFRNHLDLDRLFSLLTSSPP